MQTKFPHLPKTLCQTKQETALRSIWRIVIRVEFHLSNLILLNSEAETETASSAVKTSEAETVRAVTSWYEKLFSFKNLAYGLGTLVVLFAGFTAFILIQNFSKNSSTEVAQVSNTSQKINEAPSESSNSASSEFANSAENVANEENMMANQAVDSKEDVVGDVDAKETQNQPMLDEQETPSDSKTTVGRRNDDVGLLKSEPSPAPPPATEGYAEKPKSQPGKENTTLSQNERNISTDADKVADVSIAEESSRLENKSPITTRGADRPAGKKLEKKKDSGERESDDAPSAGSKRQIGGKTFNRTNGGWVDREYRNQKTTNIRRGTREYIRLDSGLRLITDKLDGTVVIVWKTKAYKIQ